MPDSVDSCRCQLTDGSSGGVAAKGAIGGDGGVAADGRSALLFVLPVIFRWVYFSDMMTIVYGILNTMGYTYLSYPGLDVIRVSFYLLTSLAHPFTQTFLVYYLCVGK